MNFNNFPLKYIIAKLLKHLGLCSVNYISEVHMIAHFALKSYFDWLWYWHCCLTSCQGQSNSARICSECYTFWHSSMRVTTNNNWPIINGYIIQYFMDNVSHWMIRIFWVTCSNETKFMHKFHQSWGIFLSFKVPNWGCMTSWLISPVYSRRNYSCCHCL